MAPDLLMVMLSYGFGPVWQAIHTSNWSPNILTTPGAWYDGYSAMGNLATTATTPTDLCVVQGHPPFAETLTSLMNGYAALFGASSTNYLSFAMNDSAPLQLLKLAIGKYHSVDPGAIKTALDNMGPIKLFGTIDVHYTAQNHVGLTGDYGANECRIGSLTDGKYRVPLVAP